MTIGTNLTENLDNYALCGSFIQPRPKHPLFVTKIFEKKIEWYFSSSCYGGIYAKKKTNSRTGNICSNDKREKTRGCAVCYTCDVLRGGMSFRKGINSAAMPGSTLPPLSLCSTLAYCTPPVPFFLRQYTQQWYNVDATVIQYG